MVYKSGIEIFLYRFFSFGTRSRSDKSNMIISNTITYRFP